MRIEHRVLDNGVTLITLDGRLDMQGTQEIDLRFTALTATSKAAIVVDLSQVGFIASIGMRTLLSNAKALGKRGGKMVLYNPVPLVRETLATAGIDALIPMYDDYDQACAAALGQ